MESKGRKKALNTFYLPFTVILQKKTKKKE